MNSKSFLILIIVLLSGLNIQMGKPYADANVWVISGGCSLKVVGSTNVNKFTCVIRNYISPDTLTFYKHKNKESMQIAGSMELEVRHFDCNNMVMTKDLRKALKAGDFPKLRIRFVSLNRYPRFNNQTDVIKGIVAIELAGITKQFDIDYKFTSEGNKAISLIGSKQLSFSDFNIIPPKKMGGLVQSNNKLNVEFNMKMRVLD